MVRAFSNYVGFDDGPFRRDHRGDVPLVGAVMTRTRLDGLLVGKVRRDGVNSTGAIADLVVEHRFRDHVRGVVLGGLTFAGFNVVDLPELHSRIARPILVVVRKRPDFGAIRRALLALPGGEAKWRRVEKAGPMESIAGVWVQRAGITAQDAATALAEMRLHGQLPEGLRLAHLLAAAWVEGVSRGSA